MKKFWNKEALSKIIPLSLLIVTLILSGCADQAADEEANTLAATPAPAPVGELAVDAAVSKGAINSLVYGANHGPWAGVPVTALEDLQESGLTMLRFPGGNWGDNEFVRANHVDMLKIYRDMIDAELIVSVNLREGTPEQAVELMQMFEDKGMEAAYWSIGNEPNLFAARLNKEHWTIEFYNSRWKEFAEAMKTHDPDIKLVGPDLSQYTAFENQNPQDDEGRDWMREFLRANGDLVDNVAFHRYPFGSTPTIEEVRDTSPEWDETIPYLRQLIREETGRDIPVSVMEVNSNWSHAVGGEGTPDSHYNAIWWADSLGRIINQGVEMVAFFTLSHNDGTSLLGYNEPAPTYYVYQLYQQFGDEKLHANSGLDQVSIFAARQEDGTVTLMVVNRGDEDVKTPLKIANYNGGDTGTLHRFDADHNAENLGKVSIAELDLPGQSISLYILSSE